MGTVLALLFQRVQVTIDFCICKFHLDPYSSCKNRAARAPSRKMVVQQNVSHVGASPMKNLPYAKLGKRPPKPQLWGQKCVLFHTCVVECACCTYCEELDQDARIRCLWFSQLWVRFCSHRKHRINFQIALCLGGLFLVSLASVPIIRRCIGKQRKKHTYKKSYSQQSRYADHYGIESEGWLHMRVIRKHVCV